MRTTPIGVICVGESEVETFRKAILIGSITHADPRCAVSVAIVSALIRGLCHGEITAEADVDAVLARAWAHTQDSLTDLVLEREEFERHVFAESLDDLVLCDSTMGYVYKCLGSALWCLRQVLRGRETFKSAMVKLVMQGGDADTNGAVAGGLMGALCGYEQLPREWRDGMRHKDWYLDKITALCVRAGLADGVYDVEADSDTEFDRGKGPLDIDELKREIEMAWRGFFRQTSTNET
jgi:ADP-ribosylglycohydrolase